jgi:uncharacterized membrane protein
LLDAARNATRGAGWPGAGRLTWGRFYRVTSYLKSALWVVPFFAIVLVLVLAPLLRWLDELLDWRMAGLGVSGAQALYQTVITLALSFLVFTFGSLLVAIQVASGQLTPRIIATTLLRNNVVRYSVGLFVFTLVFAVMALNRVEDRVLELVAFITAMLGVTCMATFLFLIDYAARMLRPVSIAAQLGNEGLTVIEAVYPDAAGGADDTESDPNPPLGPLRRVVLHEGVSAIVLAVDVETLVACAERVDGVVEFVRQVGDFVAHEEPLFALYAGAGALEEGTLRATVAFGPERTLEQDPMFALRILVDIALKALSPAINDPTTAVLAIDQIHRLLKTVGRHRLHGSHVVDKAGRVRVVFPTPNWDDFVYMACSEIRACGAGSVQIARRLRAMLDDLLASLPAYRHATLAAERDRLDSAIDALYRNPADRALARIPDSQGLGGSSRARSPRH